MSEAITEQLKEVIADQMDVNIQKNEIESDMSLMEDGLGLDSVAIMEFISLVEAKFSFKFDEDELNMDGFRDLQTVTELVSSKVN